MKTFELVPILVAAAIGAGVLYALTPAPTDQSDSTQKTLMIGAVVGAVVQIGVRTFGVS